MAESSSSQIDTDSETKGKSPTPTQPNAADYDVLSKQCKKQLMFLKKLKLKCDDVESQNKALEASLLDKERHCNELQAQLNAFARDQVDCNANKIAVLEAENSKLHTKLKDQSEQMDCMMLKQETANETFKCLQDEIRAVQSRKMELEKDLSVVIEARDCALQSLKLAQENNETELLSLRREVALARQEALEVVGKFEHLKEDSDMQRNILNDMHSFVASNGMLKEANLLPENMQAVDVLSLLKQYFTVKLLNMYEDKTSNTEMHDNCDDSAICRKMSDLKDGNEQAVLSLRTLEEILCGLEAKVDGLEASRHFEETDHVSVKCTETNDAYTEVTPDQVQHDDYDDSAIYSKISDLKDGNEKALLTLRTLEEFLCSLETKVNVLETNRHIEEVDHRSAKCIESNDGSTEVTDAVRAEVQYLWPCKCDAFTETTCDILLRDPSVEEFSFFSNSAKYEPPNDNSAKFETLIDSSAQCELLITSDECVQVAESDFSSVVSADVNARSELPCETCATQITSSYRETECGKLNSLAEGSYNLSRLKCSKNVINDCLNNLLDGFRDLLGETDARDVLEDLKVKLRDNESTDASVELQFPDELDNLDAALASLQKFEEVVVRVLQQGQLVLDRKCLNGCSDESISMKSTNEELQKANDVLESKLKALDDLANKYKIVAVKAKKEIAELKRKLSDTSSDVEILTNERDNLKTEVERISEALTVLNQEKSSKDECVKTLEQQLFQESEKHKMTLCKLDQAMKEASHSNVISLEIADYERSLRDLNKVMESKNDELSKLQTELQFQKEMVQSHVSQIEQLEKQNVQNEARLEQSRSASKKMKLEIAELQEAERRWRKSESVLRAQLESANFEIENGKVQLADILATNQHLQESARVTQDAHNRVLRAHESRINSLVRELSDMKSEYAVCQTEFENYKVRVHSVLKHKKSKATPDASNENAVQDADSDEKGHLEKAIEGLQAKVQELATKLSATQIEFNSLQGEHDSLMERHNKLVLNLNEQEASWKQRVEKLQKELIDERKENADVVRQMQQQQQYTMSLTLKQQMDTLQVEHRTQVEELQLQLDVANEAAARLERELTDARANVGGANRDDEVFLDYSNTERQEGEGSEFTDTVGTPKHLTGNSGFVPLDQLLNQDKISDLSSASAIEIERLESQLTGAAKKIDHLTEILHESEATNARMTEQARVLKEEIRRLERNQEREKHLANMEYVKNVIIKFFMLPSGDERERLVPVLTTILRLSPDEEQKVQHLAKGGDSQSAAGWGSYLPLPRWPGSL